MPSKKTLQIEMKMKLSPVVMLALKTASAISLGMKTITDRQSHMRLKAIASKLREEVAKVQSIHKRKA